MSHSILTATQEGASGILPILELKNPRPKEVDKVAVGKQGGCSKARLTSGLCDSRVQQAGSLMSPHSAGDEAGKGHGNPR